MASTVVMASSTISVSAMISAPNDTRCRSMCTTSMIANTIASVSGIDAATTVPGRTPRLTKLHARMMMMACQSDAMKSLMATSTVSDWLATRKGSMPAGRFAVASAISAFRLWPSARMSPESRMAMARPMAGLPLTRNIGCGGSAKPRRMVAMSPRRTMRPPSTRLTFPISRSESKAPVTLKNTRSCPVCSTPDGRMTFCERNAATMDG